VKGSAAVAKGGNVTGLSKALVSLIQAFKELFRIGKRPA
jgi:hypothetical protein